MQKKAVTWDRRIKQHETEKYIGRCKSVSTLNVNRYNNTIKRQTLRYQFKNQNKIQLYVLYRGHSLDFKIINYCVCVCVCLSSVAQSYPTLWGPVDCTCQEFCPWNFPDENTGVGCHFLLQGIFQTQGSYLSFLHWQLGSLRLAPMGYCMQDPRLTWNCSRSMLSKINGQNSVQSEKWA